MRCFLMRNGRIGAVEFLTAGTDDDLIEQSKEHFARRKAEGRFDGFEIWDGARWVYAWPEEMTAQATASNRP